MRLEQSLHLLWYSRNLRTFTNDLENRYLIALHPVNCSTLNVHILELWVYACEEQLTNNNVLERLVAAIHYAHMKQQHIQ